MDKVDLRLLMTQQALRANRIPEDNFESEGIATGTGGQPELSVIVQFTGPVSALEEAGLNIITRVDDMVTGQIAPGNLGTLSELDSVVRIEGSYPMFDELDVSVGEINADEVNSGTGIGTPPQTYTGNGVILGIIDSGIDFQHPAFLKADGTTRIVAIWDQTITATGTETRPQPYNYGVEYDRAAIDAALGTANPQNAVRHFCRNSGHGTHVASIAGGSDAHFPGIATGAEYIIVKNRGMTDATIHAMQYIYEMADALNRPCVINQSQGINSGPHDGTMATERFIDKMLGNPGRAYVKSAGNAADDNCHWGATIAPGTHLDLTVNVAHAAPPHQLTDASIEVWYPAGGQLRVTVTNPGGDAKGPHTQPATGSANHPDTFASGTNIAVGFSTNLPENRKNRIRIALFNGAEIDNNAWTIRLENTGTTPVEFDSWIERNGGLMTFTGSPNPAVSTISMPGTAREVIAVGSYITKPAAGAGPISNFSSRGPTTDGRIKPDISAPGQVIKAARSRDADNTRFPPENPGGQYLTLRGTSMSAPHVTGTIACLLERRPTLTQEQIRRGLAATARSDTHTGTGNAVPNNSYGAGKLDARALLDYAFPPAATQTWVVIRSTFYNWTEGDTPPSFEIFANENGRAIVELAYGSRDIPTAPERDPANPLRYYHTGERLENIQITNADGSSRTLNLDAQNIMLTGNRATWTMPQELWDCYREELRKSRMTPPQSQMGAMLYYRVRFEPTGGTSAILWPGDDSFNASPLNNRMNIIAIGRSPRSQVPSDSAAVDAMPRHRDRLLEVWNDLPESDSDRQSLERIFTHRFFTNHVETDIRGKILTLWVDAGPARQRLFTMLDRMFTSSAGEMTVLKQPCIRNNIKMIDHLLEMVTIVPHPDMGSVRVAEQMIDDVLHEVLDPNGQVNQGAANTCATSGIQTMLINANASEYVRLQRGLLSSEGQVTLANGDEVSVPAGIFQVARYAGNQASSFLVRTNAELAFQATMLKYAKGSNFPDYDPSAPADSPSGINTVFQATMRTGLTFDEIKRLLDGLFNATFSKTVEATPSDSLRNSFVGDMQAASEPLLTVLTWSNPPGQPDSALHAVLSMRHEAGRTFFKNPQYAGSSPPTGYQPNGSAENPPRRTDDPTQAMESMGDDDLSDWMRGYYKRA